MRHPYDWIELYLQPGDCLFGDARCRIRTLLGSCVSITLWHPPSRQGVMSHFMLERRSASAAFADGQHWDARYGDEALYLMLRQLQQAGVPAWECEARIFGGGNMFPARPARAMPVGRRNGVMARSLLQAHGIPVVEEKLFGAGHRLVVFDVGSGVAWSRQAPLRTLAEVA